MMTFTNKQRWVPRGFGILVFITMGILASSTSLAQTKASKSKPKPAKDETEARVEKLYNDGVAAARRQQWDKAEQLFEEALLLNPDPEIAANLGHAELSGGKPKEAAEHFDYYLREDKSGDAEAHAEVQALLEKAQTKIATVKVTADRIGATLYMNGFEIGQSPSPPSKRLFLNPGKYLFEAKMPNMKPGRQNWDLQAGYDLPIRLVMEEEAIGTIMADGTMRLETKAPEWHKPLGYASGSVFLVGLGMSVGFTAGFVLQNEALKTQHEELQKSTSLAQHICPEGVAVDPICSSLNSTREIRNTYVHLAMTGYAMTAIGAAGLVAWLVTRPKLKNDKAIITPSTGFVVTPSQLTAYGVF